jgi:hypothetical protein
MLILYPGSVRTGLFSSLFMYLFSRGSLNDPVSTPEYMA